MNAGETLTRLLTAWNEADAETRDEILDEALGASFTYEDPHAPDPFEGKDGMARYLEIFHTNLPDAELLPMGAPQVTHGTALVHTRLDRDGMPFARIVFVGTMGEGGLARVAGFVES